jgi:hypothetical protein
VERIWADCEQRRRKHKKKYRFLDVEAEVDDEDEEEDEADDFGDGMSARLGSASPSSSPCS